MVGENVEQGIFSYEDAIRLADQLELDLVEISVTRVSLLLMRLCALLSAANSKSLPKAASTKARPSRLLAATTSIQ